jgi:hypothetical protein
MSRETFFHFMLLLILAPVVTARADCPETPNGTHVYLGVDVSIPVNIAYPEINELDLLRVQVVWVPQSPDVRYKDQHLIDIDWEQQTHTNVDVWDGELQEISVRDLYPVILQTNTDFETGQIHIESCSIYDSAGPVLLFAHYGYDGVIFPEFTMVSPLAGRVFAQTAVTNSTVSTAISATFNNYLDQMMIQDVELATGVKPGHYLAQSFLFQNLEPSVLLLNGNPTLFFDAVSASVKQNRVYVTGDDSSLLAPLSIAGVFSNDTDILGDDRRVRNLEQYFGIVQFQSRFSDTRGGYNQIIEARPDLTIATESCVDGYTVITANFVHPSEVPGEILLFFGDSSAPATRALSLSERVSCDSDYRVEGRRKFEGETVSSGEIPVKVATAGG